MNSRAITGLGKIMREDGENWQAADDQIRIICVDDEQNVLRDLERLFIEATIGFSLPLPGKRQAHRETTILRTPELKVVQASL